MMAIDFEDDEMKGGCEWLLKKSVLTDRYLHIKGGGLDTLRVDKL